ncbi:MAG: hypothetical protein QM831_33110 [Kofleriaceae bacterium]
MAYRVEDGASCIDVRLGNIEQLFDNRDPAPFRERDLDTDLADYLADAGDDLFGEDKIKLVFWLDAPCQHAEITDAVHAHFEYMIDRMRRDRKRRRRIGQVSLAIGIVLVVALIALSQTVANAVGGPIGAGLKEGLVISCWVVMWRPIDVIIYDWIPDRRERRVMEKLLAAPIEIKEVATAGAPPPGIAAARKSDARPRRT